MVCECGQRYPMIDGVPVDRCRSRPRWTKATRCSSTCRSDIDSHWGTRGPLVRADRGAAAGRQCGRARLQVGGALAVLPADRAVGIELGLAAARRARRLLARRGRPVPAARRRPALRTAVDAHGIARPVTIVCGDALDPPLVPGVFDRVRRAQRARLGRRARASCCRWSMRSRDPGGEIVLACPYQWLAPDHARSAARIRRRDAGRLPARRRGVTRGVRRCSRRTELTGTLRRDARSHVRLPDPLRPGPQGQLAGPGSV